MGANGLVETQTAAVQEQLVDILVPGLSGVWKGAVGVEQLTAQLRPRSRPRMPSFLTTTDMP